MTPEKIWQVAVQCRRKKIPLLPSLFKTINYFIFRCITPPEAEIGTGLRLDHWGLCFVCHPNVEIGNNVRIYHGVTLAAETWIGSEFKIFIEDNVTIGVGASIIARSNTSLRIGKNAYIGAGAVVIQDVPENAVVGGVPAKIIRINSENIKVKSEENSE
jgi:serine O-acetyltransferase